jgi:ferritin
MISDKLQDAINEQIKYEFYSAYMYLAMSADCSDRNLTGFAHWLRLQAREEVDHAMRFFDFLIERGGRVELHAIDKPPFEFGSPLEIMERSLEHERFVTSRINELYDLANAEQDRPAQVMLQWFVTEQVEEEASIDEIVQRMKMFGADGAALFMLDRDLGSRGPGEDEAQA